MLRSPGGRRAGTSTLAVMSSGPAIRAQRSDPARGQPPGRRATSSRTAADQQPAELGCADRPQPGLCPAAASLARAVKTKNSANPAPDRTDQPTRAGRPPRPARPGWGRARLTRAMATQRAGHAGQPDRGRSLAVHQADDHRDGRRGDRGDRGDDGHRSRGERPVEQHQPDHPERRRPGRPSPRLAGTGGTYVAEQVDREQRQADQLGDPGHGQRRGPLRGLAPGEVPDAPDQPGEPGQRDGEHRATLWPPWCGTSRPPWSDRRIPPGSRVKREGSCFRCLVGVCVEPGMVYRCRTIRGGNGLGTGRVGCGQGVAATSGPSAGRPIRLGRIS